MGGPEMYAIARGQNNPTLEHTSHAAQAVGVARPLPGGEGAPLTRPAQRGDEMSEQAPGSSVCMTGHVARGEGFCADCVRLRDSIIEGVLDRVEKRRAEETANAARLVSRASTRGGSVMLYADSPRDDLVRWLVWCDPNGLWIDEDVKAAGHAPMSRQECWDMIRLLSDNPQLETEGREYLDAVTNGEEDAA